MILDIAFTRCQPQIHSPENNCLDYSDGFQLVSLHLVCLVRPCAS